MRLYSVKEVGVLAFAAGLLMGVVVAFASCSASPDEANDHITTGGHP